MAQERCSELLAFKQEVVRRPRSRATAAKDHRQQGRAATGCVTHACLWSHSSCRLQGHSCEVTRHHDGPFCLHSPTLGMSSRQRAVNDLQVEQSDEFMHAAAAGRGVPSGSTTRSIGRRRQQPGERRKLRSPTSPCTAGSGWMQMAVFERFQRGLAASPGDQRLVTDATRACGSAGPAVGQREARWVP